jgi:hypothetical protein
MKTFKIAAVFFCFYYGISTLTWLPTGSAWGAWVSSPFIVIIVGIISLILTVQWALETEEA